MPTLQTSSPTAAVADLLSSQQAPDVLSALLRDVAFHRIGDRGWIRATGQDRVRWLNGMVTNSVQGLALGAGCFNFVLSAQGHIQGTADVFAHGTSLLLETDAAQVAPLLTLLDRFIIMDDVELADCGTDRQGLLLAGPLASALLHDLGLAPSDLSGLSLTTLSWQGAAVDLIHAHSPVVPRFELWGDPATISALVHALRERSIPETGPDVLELLRTLEGTPRFGVDIRGRELPQETASPSAQSRALHFSKGCYLGQEIVERIRSRGRVNRTFTGFTLTGPCPAPGTPLTTADGPVGELTTVSTIPPCEPFPDGLHLALGYVRREALERNEPLTAAGSVVIPVDLPFPLPSNPFPGPEHPIST